MLNTLFAINFDPGLRGIVVVLIAVVVLIGGTYLIVGSNVGARLGILIVLASFFGWMMTMGAIWWTYGIGLKGPEPTWHPAEPITIIRDGNFLVGAEVLETTPSLGNDPVANAATISAALQEEGWSLLEESDPQRGRPLLPPTTFCKLKQKSLPAESTCRSLRTIAVASVTQRSATQSTSSPSSTSRVMH